MKKSKRIMSFLLVFALLFSSGSFSLISFANLKEFNYLDYQQYYDMFLGDWTGAWIDKKTEKSPAVQRNVSLHITAPWRVEIEDSGDNKGEMVVEFVGWMKVTTPSDSEAWANYPIQLNYYPHNNEIYLGSFYNDGSWKTGNTDSFGERCPKGFVNENDTSIHLTSAYEHMKTWGTNIHLEKVGNSLNNLRPIVNIDNIAVTREITANDMIGKWQGEVAVRKNKFSKFTRCDVNLDVKKEEKRKQDGDRGLQILYSGVADYQSQENPNDKGKFDFKLFYYPEHGEISLQNEGWIESPSTDTEDRGIVFSSIIGFINHDLTEITGLSSGYGALSALAVYYHVANLTKVGSSTSTATTTEPTPTVVDKPVVTHSDTLYDWNGLWLTEDLSYGFELTQDGDYVSSSYEEGRLEGTTEDNYLIGSYYEKAGNGNFEFEMAADGMSFDMYVEDLVQDPSGENVYYVTTLYKQMGVGGPEDAFADNSAQLNDSRAKNDLSDSRAKNDNPLVEKVRNIELKPLPFTDLSPSHWSYEFVQFMYSLGVISGYPDNTFRPNDTFSRAAFAKMLSLSYGLEEYHGNDVVYTDVHPSDWFYPYVMAAEQIKATNYYNEANGTKTYRPNTPTEREDVAVALVTLLGLKPEDADLSVLNNYNDANSISSDMKPYVALAYQIELMQGDDNGNFNPHAPLTRAAACKVFSIVLAALVELEG